MNELPGHEGKGHYLKVNLARPDTKISGQTHDGPGTPNWRLVREADLLTNECASPQYGLPKNGYRLMRSRWMSLEGRA